MAGSVTYNFSSARTVAAFDESAKLQVACDLRAVPISSLTTTAAVDDGCPHALAQDASVLEDDGLNLTTVSGWLVRPALIGLTTWTGAWCRVADREACKAGRTPPYWLSSPRSIRWVNRVTDATPRAQWY